MPLGTGHPFTGSTRVATHILMGFAILPRLMTLRSPGHINPIFLTLELPDEAMPLEEEIIRAVDYDNAASTWKYVSSYLCR